MLSLLRVCISLKRVILPNASLSQLRSGLPYALSLPSACPALSTAALHTLLSSDFDSLQYSVLWVVVSFSIRAKAACVAQNPEGTVDPSFS